jgi:hypothetical protein
MLKPPSTYFLPPKTRYRCQPFISKRTPQKMAHVFEGAPDARQSDQTTLQPSRFRPTYRALTDEEKALHDALKTKAYELEMLFAQVKPGRYNALAITALEQSVMWIVKELTS